MDFEQLVKQYHAYVVTIVYNILHGYLNEIDMQAVVNQVFFQLWNNLDKIDLEKYEAFVRGFVGTLNHRMTENEKNALALDAVAMTAECGVRFLTDYINGDKYFKIHYRDQNLARARCHLALTKDMISHLDEMQAIVDKYWD